MHRLGDIRALSPTSSLPALSGVVVGIVLSLFLLGEGQRETRKTASERGESRGRIRIRVQQLSRALVPFVTN